MLRRALVALGLVWMCGSSEAAADEPRERFVPFVPLTLDELYQKRIRFRDREPSVSVGLMEDQAAVEVGAPGPLRLMFDEVDVPKTTYAPPGSWFRFVPTAARPARIAHWVVLLSRDAAGRKDLEGDGQRRRQHLAAARAGAPVGGETRIFETGTVLGLRGNVLDTRRWLFAVGPYDGRAAADQALAAFSRILTEGPGLDGAPSAPDLFVHEELVTPPAGTILVYAGGRLVHRARGRVYVGATEAGVIDVRQVEFARGYSNHGREDRRYAGGIYVAIDKRGRLAVVNSVGAETLLYGLVPAEILAAAPPEALKAQAVTARGELLSKHGHRHFGDPFHVCSEQHCQVYVGAKQADPRTSAAVDATRGLLAVREGHGEGGAFELVESYYSASCGGISEGNDVVWGTPPSPGLGARVDAPDGDPAFARFRGALDESAVRSFVESYPPADCARSPHLPRSKFRWKRSFASGELEAVLGPLRLGPLTDAQILGRGPGGRIRGLRLVGRERSVDVLRELPVRRLFQNLNSGLFVLDVDRDERGAVRRLTFTGGGWGHGVGMCQHGAIGRALRGERFEQILAHYYGGARVAPIY